MTVVKATTKYVRISPRKVRNSANMIRGMSVTAAQGALGFDRTKGGRLLVKTLESAIANAAVVLSAQPEDLKVVEVRVDCGPTLKRGRARNKGSRAPILKRTSHFTVVVGTGEE